MMPSLLLLPHDFLPSSICSSLHGAPLFHYMLQFAWTAQLSCPSDLVCAMRRRQRKGRSRRATLAAPGAVSSTDSRHCMTAALLDNQTRPL